MSNGYCLMFYLALVKHSTSLTLAVE